MGEMKLSVRKRLMPDFGIPDIDPEISETLGQVVIHWASVEYLISMLLATFLNADQGGIQVVTTSVSVSTQTKWIQSLMAAHNNEAVHNERVSALLTRVDDLRAERNEFVHGNWDSTGCEPRTALVTTIGLNRTEIIKDRLVTKQDLSDLVVDIDDWITDYVALGRELGFPRHRGSAASIFTD
jgi:hypothetical protein